MVYITLKIKKEGELEGKAAQALPAADEARRFRGSGTICGLLAKAANRFAATVGREQAIHAASGSEDFCIAKVTA